MGLNEIAKYRIGTTVPIALSLIEDGKRVSWNDVEIMQLCVYSEKQKTFAGYCMYSVSEDNDTVLSCRYPAEQQLYEGDYRVVLRVKKSEQVATYDSLAFSLVRLTEEASYVNSGSDAVEVGISVKPMPVSVVDVSVSTGKKSVKKLVLSKRVPLTMESEYIYFTCEGFGYPFKITHKIVKKLGGSVEFGEPVLLDEANKGNIADITTTRITLDDFASPYKPIFFAFANMPQASQLFIRKTTESECILSGGDVEYMEEIDINETIPIKKYLRLLRWKNTLSDFYSKTPKYYKVLENVPKIAVDKFIDSRMYKVVKRAGRNKQGKKSGYKPRGKKHHVPLRNNLWLRRRRTVYFYKFLNRKKACIGKAIVKRSWERNSMLFIEEA